MIKAVLDTNVFISALFWKGVPYEVVRKSLTGEFLIIISPEIIEEISERLLNKFKFPLADTNDFIEIIAVNSYKEYRRIKIITPREFIKII